MSDSLNIHIPSHYDEQIHQFMTGRIKLMSNGEPLQPIDSNLPEIPYQYDDPSEYDHGCGTLGLVSAPSSLSVVQRMPTRPWHSLAIASTR